jgi:hypothetical protein
MILEQTRLLLKLYYRPQNAMSGIIDSGSWVYGAIAVVAVSMLLQFAIAQALFSAYQEVPVAVGQPTPVDEAPAEEEDLDAAARARSRLTSLPLPILGPLTWWIVSFSSTSVFGSVITLAVIYIPIVTLAVVLLEPLGSFGVVLRRDYGSLLACTFMGWAAAHLPFAAAGLALAPLGAGPLASLGLWAAAKLVFGGLMVCAVRVVFGISFGRAGAAVAISVFSVVIETLIARSGIMWYLASPWVLLLAYFFFRGSLGGLGSTLRSRQSFRHNLEAATINPRDSEAHYQLGLIYQQRRQYTEAIARFKQAVEIDHSEIDAHYQLGRIAREQGRLQDALDCFNSVITQDDKHAQSEVWREIGATYEAASMFGDARAALERFIERRPYDAEGLYRLANVLTRLDRKDDARQLLERCIEAIRTMPYYHRRAGHRWSKLAEKQLRELGGAS